MIVLQRRQVQVSGPGRLPSDLPAIIASPQTGHCLGFGGGDWSIQQNHRWSKFLATT